MRLTKHHGLGNDFLVHLTNESVPRPDDHQWARRAADLCHRRRGLGADGLIVATLNADGADAAMQLFNSDGSPAEMSGNGIRCLAQAIAAHRGDAEATYRIATPAGVREVEMRPGPDPHTVNVGVDMGAVTDMDAPTDWAAVGTDEHRPVAHLALGNPHTVVGVEDLAAVDLAAIGARVPDVNLEIVTAGAAHHEIVMRVHERGAGITEACGTGACAAAVAAIRWGLAAPKNGEITVTMDGGVARVRVDEDTVTLIGPATFVATIEVPE